MFHKIMAIGPNGILVAAGLMALLVILMAFHKPILEAMGVKVRKRRRHSGRRYKSTRMDITRPSRDDV